MSHPLRDTHLRWLEQHEACGISRVLMLEAPFHEKFVKFPVEIQPVGMHEGAYSQETGGAKDKERIWGHRGKRKGH